jgi:hypothetical protein
MKKLFLSVFLTLFAVCLLGLVFPGAGLAQMYHPAKVYTLEDGSLKEVVDAEIITTLMRDVRDKKCFLTILGPKGAQSNMRLFVGNNYGRNVRPSEKSVYIISCPPKPERGEPPGAVCGYIGGVYKCCPPTCR